MQKITSRWYALTLLAAMYMVHAIDRQMIGVIVEPIKKEFALTDTSMGLLLGLAYSVSFSLTCFPLGWLADRVNRRNLLVCVLSVWSGLTALCGIAPGYLGLVVARVGVGAAESGAQPIAMSLLSDLFRAEERSTAIGIFYLSVAIGISISFLAGGALATAFGWRVVFFIAGVPGIVVAALILLTLVEPRRRRSEQLQVDDDEQPPTLAAAAAYALGSPRLLHLVAAITLTSLTVPATWVWLSSFMIRLHHLPMREVGAIGAAAAVAQGAGSMVIGKIADHHSKAGFRRLGLVAAISTCVSGFLGFFFAFSQSAFLAIVFLFLLSFSLGACLGPSYSILLASTPSRMRGIASAALQVSINLIGVGLGPLFVGAISDIIGGTESLRPALALILSLNFWSSMHYMFVFRAMAGAGTPAA